MTDPAGPQRAYRAPCPSCGAPVEFRSAQSTHAVCAYCRSAVVREGDALKRIGRMAELFDDFSPLQLMAAGRWQGRAFTLVGRLQYQYAEGRWTEWCAQFDDGSAGWLAEDNGAYVFALPQPAEGELPRPKSFKPGAAATLLGERWSVASYQSVRLVSAQGELAHLPAPGASFPIVELRNGAGEVLSIDYGNQPPTLSRGRAVLLADLALTGLRDASAREDQGRQFACPNCGAPVAPQLAQSKSITCPQCSALIDLSQGVGGELRAAEQAERVRPLIPLGSTGQLDGASWQVVGFQHRLGQAPDDDEHFGWQEYLLYNAQRGFCFLVDAEDGWSLVRPLSGAPEVTPGGSRASHGGVVYTRQWQYRAETSYVLGEFYWQVRRGQVTQNSDYASGDQLLSSEQGGGEIIWSAGRKIAARQVADAFKLGDALARADARPFSAAPSVNIVTIIVVLVLIVIVLSLFSRCSDGGGSYGRSSGGSFGGYSSGGGHK
ncbi:MAG: DUF4178 domain-containing protein [Ottowia sp.]|uniref:DUF4178 domain-containing protein n=1 Tax=Ottowia sp. TaxID=1898956 RepID=UPI0039E2D42E